LSNLGVTAFGQGNYEEATQYLEEALTLHRDLQNRVGIAPVLINMAKIAIERDDLKRAHGMLQEALDMARESTDKFGELDALWTLGDLALKQQNFKEAKGIYRESLIISQMLGNQLYLALTVGRFGLLANAQNEAEKATQLVGFATNLYEKLGVTLFASDQAKYDVCVNDLNSAMGDRLFLQYLEAGKSASLKDIVI
jgi:tetratricopeptide (TPR) repeat protein